MTKHLSLLTVAILGGLNMSAPAAANILYNNGPINGTIGGWAISDTGAITDSFTLTSASTLTGVSLGLWAVPGSTPLIVQWGISTSPDFTNSAGGGGSPTAALTNSLFCTASVSCGEDVWDLYTSGFSLPDVTLAAGTYYLSLQNSTTSDGEPLLWDDNNGPSVAYQYGYGNLYNYGDSGTSNSESFQILGAAAIPEPNMRLFDFAALACIFLAIGTGRRTLKKNSEQRSARL